jgi:hypothetical protein
VGSHPSQDLSCLAALRYEHAEVRAGLERSLGGGKEESMKWVDRKGEQFGTSGTG